MAKILGTAYGLMGLVILATGVFAVPELIEGWNEATPSERNMAIFAEVSAAALAGVCFFGAYRLFSIR